MKKMPSTRSFTFAAALAVAAVLAAAPGNARAQVVTPNPAPTIITTAPYTITKPGFYQLGANLVYSGNGSANDAIITLNSGNVTLDFAGHYISGPSTNTATHLYGVYSNEQGNINIQNGTIAFCYIGVLLGGNGMATSLNINQRVTNMLVTTCYYEGMDLESVRGADVFNNRLSLIGGQIASDAWGLYSYGTGIRVSGNAVTNITAPSGHTGTGIEVDPSDTSAGGFIYGNQISGATYGIIGGKYQQNLTTSCSTSLSNGIDAGQNN